MTWVITRLCRDCLDTSCIEVCPVDCIYEYVGPAADKFPNQLYIDPEECIDCQACEPVCPWEAPLCDTDVPAAFEDDIALNEPGPQRRPRARTTTCSRLAPVGHARLHLRHEPRVGRDPCRPGRSGKDRRHASLTVCQSQASSRATAATVRPSRPTCSHTQRPARSVIAAPVGAIRDSSPVQDPTGQS